MLLRLLQRNKLQEKHLLVKTEDLLSLVFNFLVFFLLIWSLFWKAWALWTVGMRKEKNWFIILFLLNTVGILEIIYLLTILKKAKIFPLHFSRLTLTFS
ncbi:MAG: DUF5652 family protein [Candidatus Aenigmatarchaeota archaeon]